MMVLSGSRYHMVVPAMQMVLSAGRTVMAFIGHQLKAILHTPGSIISVSTVKLLIVILMEISKMHIRCVV